MSLPCRRAFSDEFLRLATHDPTLIAIGSDSKGSVTLSDFSRLRQDQWVEVGIAEQNAIGLAAGLANAGLKPFVTGPACFYTLRCAEQIKIDVAYSRSNVKIIAVSGGVSYGPLGTSHHALQDLALWGATPGIDVYLPADAAQTTCMTRQLATSSRPAFVRMGRQAVPDVYGKEGVTGQKATFAAGKAIELRRGADLLLLGLGETVHEVWQAACRLAAQGIEATVLDLASYKPLDEQAIVSAAAHCQAVVTVEEHSVHGGLGDRVAGLLARHRPRRQKKIAFPDEDLITGDRNALFEHYGLTAESVMRQAMQLLQGCRKEGGP